jgi:hypothetical protein
MRFLLGAIGAVIGFAVVAVALVVATALTMWLFWPPYSPPPRGPLVQIWMALIQGAAIAGAFMGGRYAIKWFAPEAR